MRNKEVRAQSAGPRGLAIVMYPGGSGEPWMVSEQDRLPTPQKINLKAMSPNSAQMEVQSCRGGEGGLFSTE